MKIAKGLKGAAVLGGLLLSGGTRGLQALELEPGFYRSAPAGMNALSIGYGYTGGNILLEDSQVPIEDAKAHIQIALLRYARYFSLLGKTARADALVPIAWAHYEGTIEGQFLTRDPHGLADPRFRLSVNLAGAPALDRTEFKNYQQKTIWGLSLMMGAPFGQYDSARLINLGANRWSFRPETGISKAWKSWCAEAAAGAWVFTKNHDYFGGSELSQKPFEYLKGDLIYTFKKRFWLAVNYGVATGGRTSVNGVERADLQTNHQAGATVTLPVGQQDAVTVFYSKGFVTRVGADFQTAVLAYSHTW